MVKLIKNEPKIIKELREAEKLGLLKSTVKVTHEKPIYEEKSDYTISDDKLFSNENDLDLLEAKFADNCINKKILQEKDYFYNFFNVFENSNDIVVYLNTDGTIKNVNKRIESMLGYKPIEVIGKNIKKLDFIIIKDLPKIVKLFRKAIIGDDPLILIELDLKHKNGNKIPVEVNTNIIKEKGKIKGTLTFIKDISNRKKMEKLLIEREHKFRMLAEQNLMGIVILQDNKVKYVNNAICDITGYSINEMYNWKAKEFAKAIHPDDHPFVMEQANKKQMGDVRNVVTRYTFRIFTKNQEIKWIDHYSKTVNYNGKPADFVMLVDITDQKKAEIDRLENEQNFRDLFENATDLIQSVNVNGNFVYFNKKWLETLGYTRKEVERLKIADILREDQKTHYMEIFKKVCKGESFEHIKTVFLCKNSEEIFVEGNVSPRFKDGEFIQTLGIFRDVTEHRRIEIQLKESEEKFRNLAEQSPNMIFINNKGKIMYVNSKCTEVLGYEKEEFYSPNFDFMKLISPESRDIIKKAYIKHMKGKDIDPYDYTLLTKAGKKIEAIISTKLIKYGGESAILGIITDITERKETEKKLIESRSHFQSLFNLLVDPVVIVDSKGKFLEITDKVEEITGFKKNDLLGKNFLKTNIVSVKSKAILIKNLIKRMAGKNIEPYEIEVNTKDGRKIPFEINAEKIEYQGKPADMIIFRDISSRKKTEQDLIFERKQLLSLFDSIDELIYVVDPKSYEILFANKFLKETFKEKKTANICYKVIYNKTEPCEFCTNKIIIEKKGKPYRWEYHNSITKKDYSITDQIIKWPDGRDVKFSLAVDVTKLKMALNELKDAHEILFSVNQGLERKVKERTIEIERLVEQKDEFIKQLSHDLKTPLTPMMILVPILQKKVKNTKDQELLEIIMRNINFMKDLVTKTIDLAKLSSGNISFKIENIKLLSAIDNIIENGIIYDKRKIKIENKIDRKMIVRADKLRLDELLINLISNSIKYTPEKGGKIIIDANKRKDSVTVSIRDSGIGMNADEIKHVFDEFYKVDDSRHNLDSSGLGLAICKRIVEKHGGNIWVESPGKGKGSTFYFSLHSGKNNKKT